MTAEPTNHLPPVRLRRATMADLGAIAPLVLALYQEHPSPVPVDPSKVALTIDWFSRHPEAGAALVVEHEGEQAPVGYAFVARYWSNEFGGPVAILDELSIAPAWRSRGVGRQVIAALEEEERHAGTRALQLEVDFDNPRAKRLYERLGFRPAGRDHLRKLLF